MSDPSTEPVIEPPATEPAAAEPAAEPAATEPATAPAAAEPAAAEPAASEPATTEPAASEPAATEPAATEPAAAASAPSEPAATEPAPAPAPARTPGITYTASPSTASLTDTFYSLQSLTPDAGSASLSDLSTDNYPEDRVPLKDPNGYDLPNPANQVIFKNQPVSWWIESINNGSIVYTPISNTVNWSYYDSSKNQYQILFAISSYMIPNRTGTVSRDPDTRLTTIVLQDNGVFNMTQTHMMF